MTLKLAMSLDGRTDDRDPATRPGSPASAAASWSTAGAPNPTRSRSASAPSSPTTRCSPPAQPRPPGSRIRVVFDSQARLPLDSQLLQTLDIVTRPRRRSPEADPSRLQALRDAGAEVADRERRQLCRPDRAALSELGRRGITSLFLEGGRTLASAFAAADQIDEARTFVAPVLLGSGAEARPAPSTVGVAAATGPARRNALSRSVEMVGDDVLITARFKEW